MISAKPGAERRHAMHARSSQPRRNVSFFLAFDLKALTPAIRRNALPAIQRDRMRIGSTIPL